MTDVSQMSDQELLDELKRQRAGGGRRSVQAHQKKPSEMSDKELLAALGQQPEYKPSAIESAAAGLSQGATGGFMDEIMGALNAVWPASPEGPGMGVGGVEGYRNMRDAQRALDVAAKVENPKTYGAGEIAGGVGAAALALPAAATASLPAAIGTGAAYGGVAGLGSSGADMTKGDVVGALKDAGISTLIGGAAGGVGYGLANGAGAIINRLRGTSAGAEQVARDIASTGNEVSTIDRATPQSTFAERGRQLEQMVSQDIGEKFRLRPSQLTGDPSLALAESKAMQFPGIMTKAQDEATKQIRQSAKWLDGVVAKVSSNPSRLDNAEVSDMVASTVERHIESLVNKRSADVGPLFQSLGNKKVVNLENTAQTLKALIDEYSIVPGNNISRQLESTLKAITNESGNASEISAKTMSRLMSIWGKASYSNKTIIEGLQTAEQRMIAGKVSAALAQDLDQSVSQVANNVRGATSQILQKSIAGQPPPLPTSAGDAATLKAARDAWRAYSAEIENTATNTINKILKISGQDGGDTLVQKITAGSPRQIAGVFNVLNKQDPAVASQLRAQMLENLLVKGGKPSIGSPISGSLGIDKLQPGRALSLLSDAEPKLQAAYAGDGKSLLKLREIMELMQRLAQGSGVRGSQTAPLMAQSLQDVSKAAGIGGGFHGVLLNWLQSFTNNEAAVLRAVSTPEGIELVNKAMRVGVGKEKVSDTMARAIMASLTKLGIGQVPKGGE